MKIKPLDNEKTQLIQHNSLTFSIANVLGFTTLIAVLLAFGHVWQVLFFVCQLSLIVVGTEYLIRKIPEKIKLMQRQNCLRADGSVSSRRKMTENREWTNLRWNVRMVFAIVVMPFAFLMILPETRGDILFATVVAWVVIGFLILRSGYLYHLSQYVFDLKRRGQQYKLRDLDLLIRREELESMPKRRYRKINQEKSAGPNKVHSISRGLRPSRDAAS